MFNFSFRGFIEHDLMNYAKDNPGIVVYVKPRRHRHPVIVAEYRMFTPMYSNTILRLS